MTRLVHTGCWGVALALVTALPAAAAPGPLLGQVVPAEPAASAPAGPPAPPDAAGQPDAPETGAAPAQTPAAAPAPYVHVWTEPVTADMDLTLIATASLAITGSPAVPLEARALEDGHVVWTSPLTARALARADEVVYGLDDGQVFALAAASGEPQWKVDTDEPGQSLAVGAQHLLVLSERAVRGIGRVDGAPAWRTDLPAPPSTALAVSGTLAVVGLQDRSLVALDPATGEVRWQASFDDIPRAVTIAGERVYLTLPFVAMCAVVPSSGRLDWCTTELRVPAVGPPVIYADKLYLALLDTTLRTFDPDTGTMLRRDSLRGRPIAAPLPMGPVLITPLSQNAFAAVRANGAFTIVPAPGAASMRSLRRMAISQDAATIVVLTIEVAGSLHLSAYTPAPEASPTAPPAPAAPASPPAPDATTPL